MESKFWLVFGVGCFEVRSLDSTSEQTMELTDSIFCESLFWLAWRRVWSWKIDTLHESDDDPLWVMITLEVSPQGLQESSVSARNDNQLRMPRTPPHCAAEDVELNDDDLSQSNFVLFAKQVTILFVAFEYFPRIAKRSLKIPRHATNAHKLISDDDDLHIAVGVVGSLVGVVGVGRAHHLSHELKFEHLFLILLVDHEDALWSDVRDGLSLIQIQCNGDDQKAINR